VLSLHPRSVRRLAIARAGLGRPERTRLGRRAAGTGARSRSAACGVIRRFGYLQLDSVSVTGARSHSLVLMSRLDGATPGLAETLLAPGTPIFEYWGHEASWLPLELYPYMEFRRRQFATHPWWGDLIGENPRVAQTILDRLTAEGPLKAVDFRTGPARAGWWDLGAAKKVLSALWSRGDIAIRRRTSFQREFDLTERVIPEESRSRTYARDESVRYLLMRALAGHGWATTGTLAATWRLRNMADELAEALAVLCENGDVIPAAVETDGGRRTGWIRPRDAELAETLSGARPRQDRGLLLSPFDPLIWDRGRTQTLFGFRQAIEIYKPASQREFGYYCLPILAGDRFVGRVDLKAFRKEGRLHVVSNHWEAPSPEPRHRVAGASALARLASALGLEADPLG